MLENEQVMSELIFPKRRTLNKSEVLLNKGDRDERFYVILQGSLVVKKSVSEDSITQTKWINSEQKNILLKKYLHKRVILSQSLHQEIVGEEILHQDSYDFEVVSSQKNTVVAEFSKKQTFFLSLKSRGLIRSFYEMKKEIRERRFAKAVESMLEFDLKANNVVFKSIDNQLDALRPSKSMQRINFMKTYFNMRFELTKKQLDATEEQEKPLYLNEHSPRKQLKSKVLKKERIFNKLIQNKRNLILNF